MLAGVAKLSSLKGTSLKSSAPERGSACVVRIAMLFGVLAKLRALTASRSPKNTSSSEGSRCALHAVIVFSSICGSCSSRELKIELKLRRRGEARPPFRSGALITSATAFRMRSTPRLTEERVELRDSDSRACIRPLSRRRSDERTVGRGSASADASDVDCICGVV